MKQLKMEVSTLWILEMDQVHLDLKGNKTTLMNSAALSKIMDVFELL